MEKREVSMEKAAIIAFMTLCLTWPYFPVLTTTPNNWREGRMGQAPTLRTPFRRKKSTIKREETPQQRGGTREGSQNRAEDQFSQMNSVHLILIE